MKKIVFAALIAALFAGCGGRPTYLDGNSLQLGLIVPSEEQIYGFQIMNALSGIAFNAPTNGRFHIEREYASSNSYIGVIHVNEKVKTTIETK